MKGVIYSDGSCLDNPGPAGIGAVVKVGGHISRISKYIGPATNNIAEYQALIHGLLEAKRLEASQVEVWLDSELVLYQLQGKYKVRDIKLKELHKKARDLLLSFKTYTLNKASRNENNQAHKLATKALTGRV